MSFCDIVVDACPRSDLYRTLDRARDMASEFGSNLAVVSYAWPPLSMAEALAPKAFSVQEQTRAMEDALAAARSARLKAQDAAPTDFGRHYLLLRLSGMIVGQTSRPPTCTRFSPRCAGAGGRL